jgi:hypothetical protein
LTYTYITNIMSEQEIQQTTVTPSSECNELKNNQIQVNVSKWNCVA